MGIPTIFIVFLIFIFVFQHNLRKSDRMISHNRRSFWDKEEKSLFVRKTDLDPNDFVHANAEALPHYSLEYFKELGDEHLYKLQERCFKLASEPMMNLSELMNSDIRLKYGAANLGLVENYEDNYNQYLRALYKLAKGYYELDKKTEALQVLEEGINMKTDISDHIILLGKLYLETHRNDRFETLYNSTLQLKTLTKSKSIQGLEQLKKANH